MTKALYFYAGVTCEEANYGLAKASPQLITLMLIGVSHE